MPLQAALRDDLLASLRLELVGPETQDEELEEQPTLRYLMGRLAPAGTGVAEEEDDGSGDAADGDDSDGPGAPPILAMNPSSIGISVVVEPGVDVLEVTATWGQYAPVDAAEPSPDEAVIEGNGDSENADEDDVRSAARRRSRRRWRRTPLERTIPIDLSDPAPVPLDDFVYLEAHVRELSGDGRRAASIFLVNRREAQDPSRPRDDEWIFQPGLTIQGVDGAAVLGPRHLLDGGLVDDPDLRSAELVHWNRPEYAVGHGCAADWVTPRRRSPISRVETALLPSYELPRVDPRDDASGRARHACSRR